MSARRHAADDLSPLGEAFAAWIAKTGLSQDAVAKMIGTKQRTLSDWTTAEKMPDAVPALLKLGALMGVTLEGLMDLEGELAPLRNPVIVREMVRDLASSRVFKRYLAAQERMRDTTPGKKRAISKMKRRRRAK